jgi:hypothetical protein
MTNSFSGANQVKLAIKMKLSHYSWYKTSFVEMESDEWVVVVCVSKLDTAIKKIIPVVCNGITIRTTLPTNRVHK